MIFDSHAHYDDEAFDSDRHDLLRALPSSGVGFVLTVGSSLASSRQAVALAEQYDFVYAAVGVHPESADCPGDNWQQELELLARHPKVKALGEMGIDHHWPTPDHEQQVRLFEEQLMLAKRITLPVVVHMRDAVAPVMQLLRKYRPAGVLHCFSGSAETAREAVSLGLYLGFTGTVTYPNNRKAPEVLRAVPHDRLLVETDCPYLAPVPLRGRRCDSRMIVHTLARMSELLGVEAEWLKRQTTENARQLFAI